MAQLLRQETCISGRRELRVHKSIRCKTVNVSNPAEQGRAQGREEALLLKAIRKAL